MADVVFNKFKQALGGGAFGSGNDSLIWNSSVTGASTVKVALISGDFASSSNPEDVDSVGALLAVSSPETVDEYSGSYTRPFVTSRTVSVDDSNNRSEYDAANITISSLPAGSANVDGILVYWVPTGSSNDSTNIPLIYFDLAGASADFMGNGGDITIQFNANGVVQVN